MYYPKSKIVENLYTSGGEYKFKVNSEEYVGYYHKFYNGKIFTGRTNKTNPKFELEPVIAEYGNSKDKLYIQDTKNKIALFLGDPDPFFDARFGWDQAMIVQYLKLKGLPTNKDNPRNLPQFHYPNPQKEDYKKTYIIRYFVTPINEKNTFIEIDKKTMKKLNDQDKEWVWEKYKVFNVVWTIVGETKEQVAEINRNILYLKQREIKRNGLIAFLRGNYTKFFKSKATLKLEEAPKDVKIKSISNPPPNAVPPIPPVSKERSEKFFKNKKRKKDIERIALNDEVNNIKRKGSTSLFPEGATEEEKKNIRKKQINDQVSQKSKQYMKESSSVTVTEEDIQQETESSTSPPTTTSSTNQQVSRNTGGY